MSLIGYRKDALEVKIWRSYQIERMEIAYYIVEQLFR